MHKYMYEAKNCMINQLFGENKNALFYGAEGHTGIDFKTTGAWEYVRDNREPSGWRKIEKDKYEDDGRIPIVACHDGEVSLVLNDNKQGMGWGLFVTGEPKDGEQIRTLYWHIETPWRSLQSFSGFVDTIKNLLTLFSKRKVVAGAIIAIGGNNGMSTGPHLHLSLDRRVMTPTGWSDWKRIDPMPYFDDDIAYCQRFYGKNNSSWWYKGKEVTKAQAEKGVNDFLSLIKEELKNI